MARCVSAVTVVELAEMAVLGGYTLLPARLTRPSSALAPPQARNGAAVQLASDVHTVLEQFVPLRSVQQTPTRNVIHVVAGVAAGVTDGVAVEVIPGVAVGGCGGVGVCVEAAGELVKVGVGVATAGKVKVGVGGSVGIGLPAESV